MCIRDRLRALHIFENDLKAILGILWGKRLMAQAEQHQSFNDAQHGSRRNRGTDTILLTKHLTYSLWRITQTNGMTFDNDAKACYDRVVMNLALLASQRLGMPEHICRWYAQVLQQALFFGRLPENARSPVTENTTTRLLRYLNRNSASCRIGHP